tara:strand:+ start:2344 stop:3507 length:1164 start_codon:yes stop_codon:yes gene_type:complete
MFRRFTPVFLFFAIATTPLAIAAQDSEDFMRSAWHDYRIVTVVEGLVNPWAMAFLPSGDMLVTERPGRLRIVRDGKLVMSPVEGLPDIYVRGQGGLLDVVAHPDFESNRTLYISYSKPQGGNESTTSIIRARFEDDALHDVEEIFEADSQGRGHYGSRIVFDGEGHIFFSVGDRQVRPSGDLEAHPAQDPSTHHGTINRLMEDGTVPADNPFIGQEEAEPSVYSYGHRNPQGMIFDKATGNLWLTEHGPQGGDEVNLVLEGANYGWPVVGYGVNYGSGSAIHAATMREGWENPRHIWVPSIGTSGLMMYDGDQFPAWRGDLFAGGLTGEILVRISLDGDVVTGVENLVQRLGRVRDVRQGPDGFIYLALEDRRGNPSDIVRLEPVDH